MWYNHGKASGFIITDFFMESVALSCHWDSAHFFLFSANVFDPLIYYSHFLPLAVSLLIGFFVVYIDWKRLTNRTLFFMMLFFSIWVLLDAVLWATEKPDVIMLVWSIQIFFDLLIYISAALFVYVFVNIDKKKFPLWLSGIFSILFIPLLLLSFSQWNLSYFDLTNCDREAVEGILWRYTYVVEGLITLWIVLFAIYTFFKERDLLLRKKVVLLTIGIVLFLLAFSSGNIVGSFTENWSYGQYGLFGLPIFSCFLSYLIVRYQILHAKLIETQVLMTALVVLIGSQFFFLNTGKIFLNFVLISITFFLAVIFGIFLIRSVKNEVRRKEELQIVTDKLAEANVELKRLDRSKTEFISIASHQLRTPLTAIKGFVSLLLEGSYGAVPKEIGEILNKVYTANERIIDLVEDLLNISRMESGRLNYEYSEVDMCAFLSELRDTFVITAKKKGLELVFECPESATLPSVWIDRQKSFEVISNLIDNALKYTREGSVCVRAEEVPGAVRVSVTDTGIGISEEAKRYLFSKFTRGEEGEKMFANGTGLGLYVGKAMMEAQGGRISVESEGTGKGSTFSVEFPTKRLIGRES